MCKHSNFRVLDIEDAPYIKRNTLSSVICQQSVVIGTDVVGIWNERFYVINSILRDFRNKNSCLKHFLPKSRLKLMIPNNSYPQQEVQICFVVQSRSYGRSSLGHCLLNMKDLAMKCLLSHLLEQIGIRLHLWAQEECCWPQTFHHFETFCPKFGNKTAFYSFLSTFTNFGRRCLFYFQTLNSGIGYSQFCCFRMK